MASGHCAGQCRFGVTPAHCAAQRNLSLTLRPWLGSFPTQTGGRGAGALRPRSPGAVPVRRDGSASGSGGISRGKLSSMIPLCPLESDSQLCVTMLCAIIILKMFKSHLSPRRVK